MSRGKRRARESSNVGWDISPRTVAVFIAFALGWWAYMVGMILTVYDGLLSLIFQPFMAAGVSAIFVALSLLAGLLLKIRPLLRWWTATPVWAGLVAGVGLFALTFGYFLGFRYTGVNPETGKAIITLHPIAALGGYFFMIFGVANWPVARRVRR